MRFTSENAKQLSAIANKKRWDNWRAKKALWQSAGNPEPQLEQTAAIPVVNPAPDLLGEARERVIRQIAKCDDLLDSCDDAKEFAMLTRSKRELWQMIYPTAGVFKPTTKSAKSSPSVE
jgi:hypothetical protein